MATITFLNDVDYDVEAHAKGCKDIKLKLRKYPFAGEAGDMEAKTSMAVFNEYNADFSEDPWSVTVFPCTGLVDKRTTITK